MSDDIVIVTTAPPGRDGAPGGTGPQGPGGPIAPVYASTAAGLADAANTVGKTFSVKSTIPGEAYIVYRVTVAGTTAVEEFRQPSPEAIQKPIWSGRKSGWPDPFFRRSSVGVNFGKKYRWGTISGTGFSWSLVDNPVFEGKALRRTLAGTSNLSGPEINLADLGAVAGDTITIRALFVGTGAVVNSAVRAVNGRTPIGSQTAMLSDAGAGTVTSSSTPQRMTVTFATPANTTGVVVHPFSNTASPDFSMVALWAYKGTADQGPAWPSLTEDEFQNLRIADLEARDFVPTDKGLDYLLNTASKITAAATTTPLVVASPGVSANAALIVSPFVGWGEMLTPAGISFNAIRIARINRGSSAAKWRKLNVVVRTGANPQNTNQTLVAVGSVRVPKDATFLTDVDILLRHPVTGANITLSDADFVSGKYLLGVYATGEDDVLTPCGPPLGVMTNTSGQSYYHSSNIGNPLEGVWTAYTANERVGFTHLMLTTPKESYVYTATTDFFAEVAGAVSGAPEFTIPADIKAVVGTQLLLQHDAVVNATSDGLAGLVGYSVSIVGPKGANGKRFFRFTPGSGDVGTYAFTAKLFNAKGDLIASRAFTITVVPATPKASPKTVASFGDSLTAPGEIVNTRRDKFIALGGTVPTFVGTQHSNRVTVTATLPTPGGSASVGTIYSDGSTDYKITAVLGNNQYMLEGSGAGKPLIGASGTLTKAGGQPAAAADPDTMTFTGGVAIRHDGLGGKTFQFFATSGGLSYRFFVSSVSAIALGDTYSVGGVTYTVTEINTTGGAGNILCTGASAPPASGTLTRVTGSGDASISFTSSVTVPGNPIWDPVAGALSVPYYRTTLGLGATKLDQMTFGLGVNGSLVETVKSDGDIAQIITYAKAIADACLADNAACIVKFNLTPLCGNTNDGFSQNYGASFSREFYEKNVFKLRKALLSAFDGGVYAANVKIGVSGLMIDRYYGYPRSSSNVAGRITVPVEKHDNAVHPYTPGYWQMGDAEFAEDMAYL